jgi:6-pyruvoyl-tetrahydropterin synthase
VLPVTCEVGLSRSVRAFHIMPGLPGPEGQLHDHDYRIEIVVDREQLDARGMVCDLDLLEAALTELTSRVTSRLYPAPGYPPADTTSPGRASARPSRG